MPPLRLDNPHLLWPPKLDLLGVGISATTCDEAVRAILAAAQRGTPAVVSCHAVHAVVTVGGDEALRREANAFEMVTPDGQPVRWALRWLHGASLPDRVCGRDLMSRLCRAAAAQGIPIYLYGSSPRTLARLVERLQAAFPELMIVGTESPPFRPLSPEEDAAAVARINGSGARVLFLGLGCPKQDRFAAAHRHCIEAVQVCVGAAFDFHAGVQKSAPSWMQRSGLEWLFRLLCQPRRLWRRYLTTNSIFAVRVLAAGWRRRGNQGPMRKPALEPRTAKDVATRQ